MTRRPLYPVSAPLFLGREREYVLDCIDTLELSWQGPYVNRLEKAFAAFCDVEYAVACSNGSAALHLALLAAGVGPNDVVIVPAVTYVATANAVRYCGALPVFCDIDPKTWCLDPDKFESLLKDPAYFRGYLQLKAVIPVHLYGMPCDMDAINDIATRYGLIVVEDAAEAHGATYNGQRVGSLGDVATFSFYGNKILTSGEGGMVVTNDRGMADRARHYGGQGMSVDRRYYHDVVGYNYRITNIEAAIALAQLEKYPELAERRRLVVETYKEEFRDCIYQEKTKGADAADWMFTVLVDPEDRDDIRAVLALQGIDTRPIFVPITEMPPYRRKTPPVSARIAASGINLPTHPGMTPDVVRYIAHSFMEVAQGKCKA